MNSIKSYNETTFSIGDQFEKISFQYWWGCKFYPIAYEKILFNTIDGSSTNNLHCYWMWYIQWFGIKRVAASAEAEMDMSNTLMILL